jgi:peptide-methionine (S)-S-oxide reductase
VGTQYRSLILYHSPEQEQTARETIQRLRQDKVWSEPIVTKVQPFVVFYPAEEYHRDYLRRNPEQGYCRAVVAPKVAKFRKQHLERLKDSA